MIDWTFVYFIQGHDKIKIGQSRTPRERIRSLQIGSPVPLKLLATLRATVGHERLLHHRFRGSHSHGEWYYATKELREFISNEEEQRKLFALLPGRVLVPLRVDVAKLRAEALKGAMHRAGVLA